MLAATRRRDGEGRGQWYLGTESNLWKGSAGGLPVGNLLALFESSHQASGLAYPSFEFGSGGGELVIVIVTRPAERRPSATYIPNEGLIVNNLSETGQLGEPVGVPHGRKRGRPYVIKCFFEGLAGQEGCGARPCPARAVRPFDHPASMIEQLAGHKRRIRSARPWQSLIRVIRSPWCARWAPRFASWNALENIGLQRSLIRG